jgi:hypothetical protein
MVLMTLPGSLLIASSTVFAQDLFTHEGDSVRIGDSSTNFSFATDTGVVQQSSASGSDGGGHMFMQNDAIASPIGDGSFLPVTWQSSCSATANGTAGMGTLHASATSSQTLSPFSVTYTQTDTNDDNDDTESTTAINPLSAGGSADVQVGSKDRIFLYSYILPYGSLVKFQLTLNINCTINVVGDGSGAQVTADAYLEINDNGNDYYSTILNFDSDSDGNNASMSEIIYARIGDSIYLHQGLTADAGTSSFLSPGQNPATKPPVSSAVADASDTAHIYLDVLTPGAQFGTDSGHDYSSPSSTPTLTATQSNGTNLVLTAFTFPNQSWVVQSSPDLSGWSNVSTNQADDDGQLVVIVPIQPAISSQFFRLHTP